MAVHPMTLENLDEFGVDDQGRLHWRGEKVKTNVRLTRLQALTAALAVAAVIVQGVHDGLEILQWLGLVALAK